MPFDLREVANAQKRALALVESPERRRMLEEFLENSGPLVETAARDALQELVNEITPRSHRAAEYVLCRKAPASCPRSYPSPRIVSEAGW